MYFKLFSLLSVFSLVILVGCTQSFGNDSRIENQEKFTIVPSKNEYDSTNIQEQLKLQIGILKSKIKNGNFSSSTGIFIDMRIPSNRYRFFIVDLKTDSILARALVAHGSGSETGKQDSLQFSNVPNSYMSSLGTYKIGADYIGNFGRSYRLIGLDKTNNKAFERAVVLHRYSCIPDVEQEFPICTSLGCPMVAEQFFPIVEQFVDREKKPVLLQIYY